MPPDFDFSGHIPPAAEVGGDESALARLAWMVELEASLRGSRKALMALDLAGIECRTSEQIGLIRKFDALRRLPVDDGASGLAVRAPELARELQSSGTRILEAARLQAALLARARSKLRILANMLAGPSVTYGPFLAANSVPARGTLVGSEAELS